MKTITANNDPTKYALVDDDVFEKIKEMKLKFCIICRGYFRSTTEIQLPGMTEKKKLGLHRLVWILKTGEEPVRTVDHIDINPANNCFENLRLATVKQQNQHRGKQKNNSSGLIGVCHKHQVNKYKDKKYVHDYWQASIRMSDGNNEVKTLPYTDEGKLEAGRWYDTKAIEYFGKFCGELNFPMPSD